MSTGKSEPEQTSCPCGSGRDYAQCCGRHLNGEEVPQTAEQLMRSRYCAFVRRDESYLLTTWHPDTRPSRVRFDERQRWLGLSILTSEVGGPGDTHGVVEFVARYKLNGKGHRLHEISRFEKIDGRWYYRGGKHL